ncbi:MAG: hypothetical protein ABSA64_11625 [Sedimentisphaerales bacterium]|jgi:hypothetical protein
MNYDNFSKWFNEELPFNRKEKFFTGTVLPALLFNNGLSNFYHFLRAINNFPAEVNEESTGDNFIFFTEYNLKEASGDRNIGRKISTKGKDTPDVIIEILKPKKIFIVIEAKMFDKVSEARLIGQISDQRVAVIEPLKETFQLAESQIFHIALVPETSGLIGGKDFQVINWEFFVRNKALDVASNYFYNYLKYALDKYQYLVSKHGSPSTVKFKKTGQEVYENGKNNGSWWVGIDGGENTVIENIKNIDWRNKKYNVNTIKPLDGRKGNWITSIKFAELVDKYEKG